MAKNAPTVKATHFPGLRTADSPHEVGRTGLVVADNVDITKNLKARRRSGRTRVYTGTVHAAWGDDQTVLLQSGASLLLLDTDGYTTTVLRTGLTFSRALAATRVGAALYWSNGYETGVLTGVTNRSLGLPRAQPTSISTVSGRLGAGRYHVGLSYQRDDGQRGPLANLQLVELPADSGFVLGLPTLSEVDVDYVNVWLTAANGSTPFLIGAAANGESTFTFRGEPRDLSVPARTLDLAPFPAFTAVANFNGRLYGANGSAIFASEPFGYELHNPVAGAIPFTSKVHVLGAVRGGLWVGTETEVAFLKGSDPDSFSFEPAAAYRSVPGTLVYVPGTLVLDGEQHEDCVMWQTERGACVGFPDGTFKNATERRVIMSAAVDGAAMFRRENGQAHFVSIVRY